MIFKRAFHETALFRSIKKPLFDVKSIILKIPEYTESIKNRQLVNSESLKESLEKLPSLQQRLRSLDQEISDIQHVRKSIEKQVKDDKAKAKEFALQLKELKQRYQKIASEQKSVKDIILDVCGSLPNLIHESVPISSPQIIHWINQKDEYKADPNREHLNIMTKKHMVDFQIASNVTGTSWYYLINEGAMLEHALVQYATKKARKAGFQLVIPPSVVRNEIIDACGFRPRDMNNEQQIYHLSDTDLGLTATAEIALAGLGLNSTIDLENGPRKVCGVNRAYRAEAGARGKDTKGLYRVHEFTKVELFVWCKPQTSESILEELKNFQIDIVNELGLSAQVINIPSNDLGSPAYKKYDIEAWMPGRGTFGEITSTSNCTDFQSRRTHTKFRDTDGILKYVHTLNGTAMAIPRILIALVENNYDPVTNKISIPTVLQQYMDNRTHV